MNIVFLVIILICLAVMAVIFARKFPQLANLDLTNLEEEKQFQTKQQIIGKRIAEHNRRVKEVWAQRLRPVIRFWGRVQLKFRIFVGQVERLLHHEQSVRQPAKKSPMISEEKLQKIPGILAEADQMLGAGNLNRAEELYISAIKIDKKCAAAYRGLGDTYFAKNSLEESRETYRFALHLDPGDDSVMVKLAQIAESQGDLEEAIQYYQQATVANDSLSPRFYHLAELLLKVGHPDVAKEAALQAVQLEGKNPKYLDLLLETAIICGDKAIARLYFNELRLVNPDNKKLDELLLRIDRL